MQHVNQGFKLRHMIVCLSLLAVIFFVSFSSLCNIVQCNATKESLGNTVKDERLLVHDGCVNSSSVTFLPDSCSARSESPFDAIYQDGVWQSKLPAVEDFYNNAQWPPKYRKAASGIGSNLGYYTNTSLAVLRQTIKKHGIQSMIDLPCGDLNWIFDSYETDSLPLYLGLDVAKAVLDIDKKRFAHHSNKHFRYWDGVRCPLPKYIKKTGGGDSQSFDMIHTRDLLQHLPLEDCIRLVCNVFQSGSKIWITTNFNNEEGNRNIPEGHFYKNDLNKPPFLFPKISSCVLTHPNHEAQDYTCIYDLKQDWVSKFVAEKC